MSIDVTINGNEKEESMDYIYIFTYRYPWENGDDDVHRYDFRIQKKEREIKKISFLYIAGIKVSIKEIIKLYKDGRCVAVKGE